MDLSANDFKFVQIKNALWIPGAEICRKLQYKKPAHQAEKIWNKHQQILSAYSTIPKLGTVDSKKRQGRAYDEIGARFFITKCNRPLANAITIELIQEFIRLRDEMALKNEHRSKGSQIYKGLADQLLLLQDDENSKAKDFIYSNLARNNCKIITGLTPKQLREQRHVKFTREGLSSEESIKLSALEYYQSKYLKNKTLTHKEAYIDLKTFSARFIEALQKIE